MFGTRNVTTSKGLLPAGFVLALAVGAFATAAPAETLADYYKKMFEVRFCPSLVVNEEEGDSIGSLGVQPEYVDQEFIDADLVSQDVAPIFDQLNAAFEANPEEFCAEFLAQTQ